MGFSLATYSQAAPPGIDDQEFRGDIDRIITEETVEQGSAASSEGQRNRREILRFSDGSVVQQVRLFGADEVQTYSEFSYDNDGRVEMWTGYGRNDQRIWQYRYEYDEQGRLQQETVLDESERVEETTLFQYEGDQLIEEIAYVGSQVEWRKSYTRNSSDSYREWSLYDGEGMRFKHVEEYLDDSGNVVREVHYDQFGGVYEEVTRRFDAQGRLWQVDFQNGLGELIRLIEYRYDRSGRLLWSRTTLAQSEEPTAEIERYYRDDRGNWTRRVTTVLVGPIGSQLIARRKVAERHIRYEDGTQSP